MGVLPTNYGPKQAKGEQGMTINKSNEINDHKGHPGRRLGERERATLKAAESYSPASSADWLSLPGVSSAPTQQDDALDKLAAASAPNDIQEATGTITSAEILALNATPKELLPAPASGYVNIVEEIELLLDFNTAAYVPDAGEDLTIEYEGGQDLITFDNDSNDFLVGTADERRLIKPPIYDEIDLATIDAEAIRATILVGEVITGDSDVKWRIRYRTVQMLTS